MTDEQRVALVHRVMVLVTSRRLILIRQEKVRPSIVLRGEMRWGSEVGSRVAPKRLEDYEGTSIESLTSDPANITIPNDRVISLRLIGGQHRYHVHHLELKYSSGGDDERSVTLYLVPLGSYLKPRRATQSREAILLEYAVQSFEILKNVLPARVIVR